MDIDHNSLGQNVIISFVATLVGINVNGMNAAVLDSESPEVRVLVGSEMQEKFVTAKVDYFVSKIIS